MASHSLAGSKAGSGLHSHKELGSKTNLQVTRLHIQEWPYAEKICDSVFVPVSVERAQELRVFLELVVSGESLVDDELGGRWHRCAVDGLLCKQNDPS